MYWKALFSNKHNIQTIIKVAKKGFEYERKQREAEIISCTDIIYNFIVKMT